MSNSKSHWDRVYRTKSATAVSWYQPSLTTSLELIKRMGLRSDARIVDVGSGTSTLVDDLLALGFHNITVLDISAEALASTRKRLGKKADSVAWIDADILTADLPAGHFDLWHDRAVFHFLTNEDDRRRYVQQAKTSLSNGGHIVVATFGLEGPQQCSGLDVVRYDPDALHGEFGQSFAKIDQIEERHMTPWGAEQEFVYCYCRLLDSVAVGDPTPNQPCPRPK